MNQYELDFLVLTTNQTIQFMNPTIDNIAKELCDYLSKNILADSVIITSDSAFTDLGIDSSSIVELVLFIERKFGVEIPDEQLTPQNLESALSLAKCTHELMG